LWRIKPVLQAAGEAGGVIAMHGISAAARKSHGARVQDAIYMSQSLSREICEPRGLPGIHFPGIQLWSLAEAAAERAAGSTACDLPSKAAHTITAVKLRRDET
jgi:hypothetical protein